MSTFCSDRQKRHRVQSLTCFWWSYISIVLLPTGMEGVVSLSQTAHITFRTWPISASQIHCWHNFSLRRVWVLLGWINLWVCIFWIYGGLLRLDHWSGSLRIDSGICWEASGLTVFRGGKFTAVQAFLKSTPQVFMVFFSSLSGRLLYWCCLQNFDAGLTWVGQHRDVTARLTALRSWTQGLFFAVSSLLQRLFIPLHIWSFFFRPALLPKIKR